ncbi:MAG: hypothetical protein GY797_16265 [Deltaproteobacteria bacterium]|nr:hypothetical protein [Deltaproteobacteria bacterium]
MEKETDRLMAKAERERQKIVDKALEEAKQVVDQAIRQSQDALRKLPASTREEGKQHLKTLHKESAVVRQKLRKEKKLLKSEPKRHTAEIVPGGKVRLSGFEQTGTVLNISKDGKQAELQVGAMRIEMPVDRLTPISSSKTEAVSPKISVSDFSTRMDHENGMELVIVGKRVEEALEDVDKYLDQAFLSGLSSVSIVHGIGTGKLKQAVSNLLRSHPHVISYSLDKQNYGMTNIQLTRR